ncbi:Sterol O-acyltransferase [Taphrina deformans PYCC 5710]|uniref:O-acyltransferase n=1 Tax=Taphrina deformans (strain PYCC 5710 / ATCC 11124 / CBS 356.35 / IMI 108563 / JCM 9778 / NBRC 8474) TaxID=1097556 RepID=S0BE49_TAPDE|nr:Sterol O-acyltransferase [Taphrina deformans PYCC 5710]|eukprot:CCG81316.1 Sterol O-acyltransferase [Taphrina deformans PYCC 5710]
MATSRPFLSRKPTKDPADLSEETADYKKIAADHEAAKAVLAKDKDGSVSLTENEKAKVKQLNKEDKERAKGEKVHKQFRDVKFAPNNTAFDRHNPERSGSFHGFFALFWLGLAFLAIKTLLQHYRRTGNLFRGELMTMYKLDAVNLFWTDFAMVTSSFFVVFLQKLVFAGLSWNKFGWLIENLWQTMYLVFVVHRSYTGNWQWIQSVVVILHCFVMLMKQHSYAAYMGYLSEVYKTKQKLEKKLVELRRKSKAAPQVKVQPPSPVDEKSDADSCDSNTTLAEQDNGKDTSLLQDEEKFLADRITDLSEELTHDGVTYPENLTFYNYLDYLLVPSLVYDIVYPRTKQIRWWYVCEKTLATLGTFFLMTMIVEHYILPIIPANLSTMTTNEKLAELPWLMLDMVFPFITMYLLTFYIIFECVCQWFAEVTRFADRNFYNDWWNSLSWENFARDWNVPVHRFLLRHVYHSSMSVLQVKKGQATLITFFLSSVVHEVVMACMTKKIRFYLLSSQMLQLPLVVLMRTKLFKRNPAAANVFFWFGLFCGPSFLCLAYVLF